MKGYIPGVFYCFKQFSQPRVFARKFFDFVLDKFHFVSYLSYFFGEDPSLKFVVFAQGRSGSTLLVDLLNSHNGVRCDGEILNGVRRFLFPYVFGRSRLYSKTYGFKMAFWHLRPYVDEWPAGRDVFVKDFLLRLHERGWKFIHLKRNNVFHQCLSVFISRHSGKYYYETGGVVRPTPVFIDINELFDMMRKKEELKGLEKEFLRGIPHITLNYETDLENSGSHQRALDRVFSFLGLPSCKVSTNLVRMNPDPSVRVENWDEVRKAVLNSEFSRYL